VDPFTIPQWIPKIIVIIFFQVADDRNAGTAGRFVKQGRAVFLLKHQQLIQVLGNQFFIRRNHGLAFLQSTLYNFISGIGIVNQFHDGIDGIVVNSSSLSYVKCCAAIGRCLVLS
jgi:hypothetical protein